MLTLQSSGMLSRLRTVKILYIMGLEVPYGDEYRSNRKNKRAEYYGHNILASFSYSPLKLTLKCSNFPT